MNLKWLKRQQEAKIRRFFHKMKGKTAIHRAVVEADRNITAVRLQGEHNEGRELRKADRDEEVVSQWKAKVLHGKYPHELSRGEVDRKASLMWLTDGFLFPETEGVFMAIQDGVIKTRNYQKYILKDGSAKEDRCRMCGKPGETIEHITSACEKLVAGDYKDRHDSVAKVIHSSIARKWNLLEEETPYWEYKPDKIIRNARVEILWDRTLHTYKTVAHNRPDIVVKDRGEKKAYLIDIAIPNQHNMMRTIQHKIDKYRELASELERQWKMRVKTVPIVITTGGVIPRVTTDNIAELGGGTKEIRAAQKAVILHTTRLVRKVIGASAD